MAKKYGFSLVNILLYLGLFIVMYYIIICINSKYNVLDGFKNQKLSGGEIAGITIGSFIGLLYIMAIIFSILLYSWAFSNIKKPY